MQPPSFTSWPLGICTCVLLLACMLAAPAVVHAQYAVPLTLNYHEDLEEEGPLPDSTEVLVYHEAGTRSTPLSAWGSRQAMGDALAAKADESFGEVFSRIGSDGATDSVRVAPEEIAYVLARVPENGTENSRFYETQIGGEDVEPGPGLDLVVSGNMAMSPVSKQDTAWAASTFERVIETELNLQNDGQALSEDADVLVWTRPEGTEFERGELSRSDSSITATTVTAAGDTTETSFERTRYSDKAVYVLVRTTNTEDEPVLYESVGENDGAGFVAVTDGTIQMQPVPEDHRATMAAFFPEQESGGGGEWFTWTFYGLVGGLLLVVVLIVGRGLTKKKQKKNRRREKSMRERFWEAASSAASGPKPAEETLGQELVEAGAEAREKGAVSSRTSELGGTPQTTDSPDDGVPGSAKAEAKINAQQKEINVLRAKVDAKDETIASLKKKLQRKDQELERKSQKLYDRIQTIQNLKEKRKPEEETESALKQQVEELNAENEELSEDVDRLSATVAEKNEALQSAQSEEPPAYEEVPARDDEETAKYIEELEDENEWLEQTMKALRRRLSDAPVEDEGRESIGALYVAELRTKNEQLEATVSDLESKLTETTDALEAAQAEAKATDAASSNHDATNEQVAELEETRDHLERRLRKDRQTLKNAQETVEQLRIEKQDLEAKAQQLRQAEAENEELKTQIESLRAKIVDLKAGRAAAPADESPSEPDDAEVDAAYAEIQQKLGNAFQSWCQQGRVMVGRYYMFERAVQDTYPDATVSPIYYTPEAAISFQFEDRRAVATFWLVEIRGTSFLLPVPRRDGTFEALEPAVPAHSDATPAELAHAIPARVVASDSGYEIDEAGQLNFEASLSP